MVTPTRVQIDFVEVALQGMLHPETAQSKSFAHQNGLLIVWQVDPSAAVLDFRHTAMGSAPMQTHAQT